MSDLGDLVARHPALSGCEPVLDAAVDLLAACLTRGGRLLVCGNGGSAADADHIVGELMKGMTARRPLGPHARQAVLDAAPDELGAYLVDQLEVGYDALNLASQSALLTAVANDTAGDMGFAQQVYGYGRAGDVLWALSTSGRSRNVLLAAATARAKGMSVLGFTGTPGEPLGGLCDVVFRAPASATRDVQELHLPAIHGVCEAVDRRLAAGRG
jgi:D-sedoheptulose 7-phosphate isomerase